jgi:hypothetical protein
VDRELVDEVQREMEFPGAGRGGDGRPSGWSPNGGEDWRPEEQAPIGLEAGAGAEVHEELAERLRKLDAIEASLREVRASLKNLENLLNFSLWVDRNV